MMLTPRVTETHRVSPYAPAVQLTPSQAHALARCQSLNPADPQAKRTS